MAEQFFDTPPALRGDEKEQLVQLYNHLYRISEQLNVAMRDIDMSQLSEQTRSSIQTTGQAEAQAQKTQDSLKSIIIKTAEIVNVSMDEIRTELNAQYTAISEQFGEYSQTITNQVAATAEGIMQDYHIEERITAVETDTTEFINNISAYIFSGILDPNDPSKVGIAIGYNVTNEDGTLNQANKMATFTADRLSFWINQTEAAYFSNSVFHIANGEVTDAMRMGSYIWKVLDGGAMGLMKG